jgi:hypothetical protein
MNHDSSKNPQLDSQVENPQLDREVEEAIKSFRLTMHSWSERELNRRPAAASARTARSLWHWRMAPAVTWSAAAALAIAAVGVPVGVHHHNVVIRDKAAAEARIHRLQEVQAAQIVAGKAEDDKLLEHVDTDIAQDAPDAMQPLASLMANSGAE